MRSHAIELLVLDAHGVVLNNPFRAFLGDLARLTDQDPESVWARWERELRGPSWSGALDDQRLWRELAGDRFRAYDWQVLLESRYRTGPVAPYLCRWSRQLPVWMLSNHRSHWLERRLRRFGLHDAFERILVSDAIGALKPSREAFAPMLARVSTPGAVLFIDDQARNVAAARALGMTSLHLTSATRCPGDVDVVLTRVTRPVSS